MVKRSEVETFEDKVDLMVHYLQRMDKRDQMRTYGGFIRGLIGLLPIIFFLWSAWYVIHHGDQLLDTITQKAAEQAAAVTTERAGNLFDRVGDILP